MIKQPLRLALEPSYHSCPSSREHGKSRTRADRVEDATFCTLRLSFPAAVSPAPGEEATQRQGQPVQDLQQPDERWQRGKLARKTQPGDLLHHRGHHAGALQPSTLAVTRMNPVERVTMGNTGAEQSARVAADVLPGDPAVLVQPAPEGDLMSAEGAAAVIVDGEVVGEVMTGGHALDLARFAGYSRSSVFQICRSVGRERSECRKRRLPSLAAVVAWGAGSWRLRSKPPVRGLLRARCGRTVRSWDRIWG